MKLHERLVHLSVKFVGTFLMVGCPASAQNPRSFKRLLLVVIKFPCIHVSIIWEPGGRDCEKSMSPRVLKRGTGNLEIGSRFPMKPDF